MPNINILDYAIHSSSGDLEETIDSIKKDECKISSKKIRSLEEEVNIPFFSFENEILQNQDDIYQALRDLLIKITSKMSVKEKASTALLIGTSLIDWHLVDAINNSVYEYKKTPFTSKKSSIDSYAKELSIEFGLNEFTMTINTACTSSANALLEASNLIECGVFEYAIIVGLEIYSPIMSSGFYNMDLISHSLPKPFDVKRDGLVLGEAIGAILLGKKPSKWELLGGFSNCNSNTITSVSQDGHECVEVMEKALQNTHLNSKDITALKAHGTGSHSNDLAEMNAISHIFDKNIQFTALKPYIGHTIGASGVVEIALFMGAIDNNFLPKTLSCNEPINKEYQVLQEHTPCSSGIFMCNYFGFGGNNISLIIKKEL